MSELNKKVFQAVQNGDKRTVKKILKKNPELIEQMGASWINMSIRESKKKMIGFLLKLGCNINAIDYLKIPPLTYAARDGNIEMMKWLMEQGAVINLDSKDSNPLFMAIYNNQIEVVRFLLDKNIDYQKKYPADLSGETALESAKYFEKDEIVVLLGGDPNERLIHVKTSLPDFTGKKMNNEKIQGIEQELGITIPEFYKTFLLNEFPEDLFFIEAPDNDQWIWLNQDSMLFHTARSFIAYNSQNPKQEKKKLQSEEFFVIGTNGGGDDWCISLNGNNTHIFQYLHETEQYKDLKRTLEEHISFLLDNL